MEQKTKVRKLSTNRFKVNGIVYKRVKSTSSCIGCSFEKGNNCTLKGIKVSDFCMQDNSYYHFKPNEI
jgi:hypothetical protein